MSEHKEGVVELRFDVPRWVVDVIDAHVAAKRLSRNAVSAAVLADWAKGEIHLATVVGRAELAALKGPVSSREAAAHAQVGFEKARGRQSPGFDFGVRLVAMHARICRGGASGVIPVPAQTTVRVEPSGFAPLDGIA